MLHAKVETCNLVSNDASQHKDSNYKVISKIDPLAVKAGKIDILIYNNGNVTLERFNQRCQFYQWRDNRVRFFDYK